MTGATAVVQGGATQLQPSQLTLRSFAPHILLGCLAIPLARLYWQWRQEIALRLKDLEDRRKAAHGSLPITKMVRAKPGQSSLHHVATTLDLTEEYIRREAGGGATLPGTPRIGLTSLSTYLSSLQAAAGSNVQAEVDALLAHLLVRNLGPALGASVLPILGRVPLAQAIIEKGKGLEQIGDGEATVSGAILGGLGKFVDVTNAMSIMTLGSGLDSFGTWGKRDEVTGPKEVLLEGSWAPPERQSNGQDAISMMVQGETVAATFSSEAVPNPFVVESHFEKAIEEILEQDRQEHAKRGEAFDPDAKPVDVPWAIDETLLPDLYKGFGGALFIYTHREVARNRLFATLLNRLGANDILPKNEAPFTIRMHVGGKDVTFSHPDEFVAGLQDSGHEIKVQARINCVSFGHGLCVKEENGTWTNIPIALVLRSGYEDEDGTPAHSFLTHGGINIDIWGPLVPKGQQCNLQHHHAIDGICGWYTTQNRDVPWLSEKMELGKPLAGKEALRAVRLSGMYACVLNSMATRLGLKFGGYGLSGICLDFVAVIEWAMYGTTDAYPTMSNGRFYMHAVREAKGLLKKMEASEPAERAADMKAIVGSMLSVPNDLTAGAQKAQSAARRLLKCTPPSLPFKAMVTSKRVLETILSEEWKQ